MADTGESLGGDPLFLRAAERYGGREAVGSALWLEHFESITYSDEAGAIQTITSKDLAEDEKRESELGFPNVHIGRAYKQDASIVTKESWLRSTFLPTLPVKITGDSSQPPLKFEADIKVFTVPRELARGAGVIFDGSDPNRDASVTLSLRFVPLLGRVASFGVYPYTANDDYGITAMEVTDDVIKMGVGHNKYFELYREPQTEPLLPLTAPHQF